jgi:hypothetical protein
VEEEKNLCRASVIKTHGKDYLPTAKIFCPRQRFVAVRFGLRTSKKLFAVRPVSDARQRFERTAKI